MPSTNSEAARQAGNNLIQFIGQLSREICHEVLGDTLNRLDEVIARRFGLVPVELVVRRGRPPGVVEKKPRKKAPPQLCPVPRCPNRAAPAFGMVCAKHKDWPKVQIDRFRAARRARKGKK